MLFLIPFLFFAIWLIVGVVTFMDMYAFSHRKFHWPKVQWKKYFLLFLAGPGWWIGLMIDYLTDFTEGIPAKIKKFFYEENN